MTRSFRDDPVAARAARPPRRPRPAARRAPARPRAGTSWCSRARETDRFWRHAFPPERRGGFAFPGLFRAPVIALAVRRPARVRRALRRARQGPHRSRRRARRVADAVLDGRRVDGGDDAAARGRGRPASARCCSPCSTARPRCAPSSASPTHLQLLGAIALGWPAEDDGSRRDERVSAAEVPCGDRARVGGRLVEPSVERALRLEVGGEAVGRLR